MKKFVNPRIYRAIFIILSLVFCVVLFSSCQNKTTTSGVYTRQGEENGVTYYYTLTLDESKNTFSLTRQSSPVYVYSGTFTNKNGYFILESEEKGTEYVKIVGNTFSFFVPDGSQGEPCEHDYIFKSEKEGTCSSRGYIVYSCSKCGNEKTEYTTYGNHAYKTTSYKSGNCKTKGVTTKQCSLCGDTVELLDKEFGEHTLSEETRVDLGCLNKIEIRARCTTCNAYFENVALDEYGSHSYDANGVCTTCKYDKTGLCHHDHADENDDGLCDDCLMKIEAGAALKNVGYYLSNDGKLYFGAYPALTSDYEVSDIISEGKFDKTTGYYRYNNASFAVKEKNGEKYAFMVTPLIWSKFTLGSENYYACDYIVDHKIYLNTLDIQKITTLKDNKYYYEYYNKNYYDKNSDTNVLANDWKKSALYEFANNEFLSAAFTPSQLEKIIGNVEIPKIDFGGTDEENEAALLTCLNAVNTAYSLFNSTVSETSLIFTSSQGTDGNTVKSVIKYHETYEVKDGKINNTYGFVPIIKISAE